MIKRPDNYKDIYDKDKLVPTIMSKHPHPDVFNSGLMKACIDGNIEKSWKWNETALRAFSEADLIKILQFAMWVPGEDYY